MVSIILIGAVHADSPKPKILLVDDDVNIGGDYISYFKSAIQILGYSCDTDIGTGDCDIVLSVLFSPYNGPGYDTMKNYDIVIWFTGNTYSNTLTSDDRTNLKKYLDGGGFLFLTGQDIGYDISDETFYRDYMGSSFVVDNVLYDYDSYYLDVLEALPRGINDDPITGGLMDLSIISSEGANNQRYPSEIAPSGSYANPSFYYSFYLKQRSSISNSWIYGYFPSLLNAAMRVNNGTYKLVYFAFGFEALGYNDRNAVMQRVVNYLSPPMSKSAVINPSTTNSNPVLNATCQDNELYSHINASEYFVKSYGADSPLKSEYGNGIALNPDDGGFDEAVEAVNGTIDISGLDDGNYTVYVHCRDKSGYWGKFDNFTFTVDKTPPEPPLFVVAENNDPYTNKAFPDITIVPPTYNVPDFMGFSCDNINYTDWIVFGGSFASFNVADPFYGCSLGDGIRSVYVRVKDYVGNIQTEVKFDDIILDRLAPKYVPDDFYPMNNSYVPVNVGINYNITDDWSFHHLTYNAGNSNVTIFSSSGSILTGWSTGGEKHLALWAYDEAGNVNHTSLTYIVDVNAPFFDPVEPMNNSYLKTADNVTVNVSDDYSISSFWYNANNGFGNISVDVNSSFDPNWTSEGEHIIDVWANDSAGNVNHEMYRFVVDNTLPGIFSISYENKSNVTSVFSFVLNTTDNQEVYFRYYNNGSGALNGTFNDLVPFVPGWIDEGWNDLLLWVIDGAQNVNHPVYSYFVDNTAPSIVSVVPSPGSVIRSVSNITIDADDPGVGVSGFVYNNGSVMNKTFSDNAGFNPGWSVEGTRYLFIWVNDTLGNVNYSYYSYVVDNTPPVFAFVSPQNGSYVSLRTNISIGIHDSNGVAWSWYNNGSLNYTFDSLFSFNPGWSVEGSNDLYVWANDSAGNVNGTYYRFVLDKSPPLISVSSPPNGSFIQSDDMVVLSSTDGAGIGVDKLWYSNGSGANKTVSIGTGFVPGWSVDGNYTLYVWSNDTLGNINYTTYGFYVDMTGPNTCSNYTYSGWVNENQDVLLICDDGGGVGCSVTRSCLRDYGSATCLTYYELDVVSVTCAIGSTCRKYLSFLSNDSLGNVGPVNQTSVINIDRGAPLITIQNPANMQVVSGMVDILSEVSDSGIGVNASWYDINVTVANGTLNNSFGWDAVWNSSDDPDGDYNLTIYANDSFGYTRSVSVLFKVDNNLPNVVIHYPREVYINGDFSLDLRAARVGGNLTNCSYYIYNSTDVLNSSVKFVSDSQCNFSWVVDTSLWATGNYSINFTAHDGIGNNATDSEWLVFDVDGPVIYVNSPLSDEWTKGEIGVNYSTTDEYIDLCYYRYKDGLNPFSGYYSVDCGSLLGFSFDTAAYCSDTKNSDCLIEVNASDKAGNSNIVNVSFNVDNSPPVVSILDPLADAWFNGTFGVSHSEIDPEGQTCGYRISGSDDSPWAGTACNGVLSVVVSSYCSDEGVSVCTVYVNSTNNVGDAVTVSRNYSIDFVAPYFVSVSPPNGSFLKSSTDIRVDVNDSLSGVSQLMYDNGSGLEKAATDNVYFNPGWTGGGNRSLNLWVADAAGNINYTVLSYFVDDTPPYIASISPVNGSSMKLDGNVTVDVADDGAGIGELKFDNNEFIVNESFADNAGFDPWDSGGNKTLDLWLKDSLGNLNHTVIRYFVDTVAPNVSLSLLNGSYLRSLDNITAYVEDVGVGVNSSWYDSGLGSNNSFVTGVSFNPGWVSEGSKQMIFYANDSFGNMRIVLYKYVVDDSAPIINKAWVNATAVKDGSHVLVSVNATDGYSGVDSVFVDVLNTSRQYVGRVKLNYSSSLKVYRGTVVINGVDTGNYTLNVSVNDTVGWTSYGSLDVVVDNLPPVIYNAAFDVAYDSFYLDRRLYTNESVRFMVNVSDRLVSSVVATVDAPYGAINYSLLPLNGNYSDDGWNFTLYNTNMTGIYRVSLVYAIDALGNVNVTSDQDEFIVVGGGFFVSLGGASYISANQNRSVNISIDFNRTLNYPNLTVYVPLNSPWNSSKDVYFLNNSVFACAYGVKGCGISTGVDGSSRVAYMNVSGNSTGSLVSLYSASLSALYPLNDSNVTWYLKVSDRVYSNSTLIRTPYLNLSSVMCNDALSCVVNQSDEFALNVTLDNVYRVGNNTGDAYGVVIYTSIGSVLQLNDTLGDIASGSGRSVALAVNVTSAGNFTVSLVARDAMSRYNSSVLNVSLEVKDTEGPTIINPFADGPSSVYIGESFSAGVWVSDNLNISGVWAPVLMPNGTYENQSFYLDIGSHHMGLWRLKYNQTVLVGNYNVTDIFSNDTSGNMARLPWGHAFNVLNLSVLIGFSDTVLNVTNNLFIYANVSGNATTIGKVEAVISKPRGAVDVRTLSYKGDGSNGTYFYELDYSNVSRSGNYSVNVTVYSGSAVSSLENFSVNFGAVDVMYSGSDAVIVVPVNRIFNITWFVVPAGGDVLDINSSLSIENLSVINLTNGNFNVSVGDINIEDYPYGRKMSWTINSSGIGLSNMTLIAESGVMGGVDSDNIILNVTDEDVVSPNITGSYAQYQLVNLYEVNPVYANVSDNSLIDNVSFEIYYPMGAVINHTAEIVSPGLYKFDFPGINETGEYACKIYAYDVSGNLAYSDCSFTFNATDMYDVSVSTDHAVYNKGETIYFTVAANNVNNKTVDGYNLTLILNDSSSLVYLVDDEIKSSSYREILGTDMPVIYSTDATYTVNASVLKNGNSGINSLNFTVSNILVTKVTTFSYGDYFKPGNIVPINVTVSNKRGEGVTDARVTATYISTVYELERVTSNMYVYMDDFLAPSPVENPSFGFGFDAIDSSKNGGFSQVLLTTLEPVLSSGPSDSGAGGGSGEVDIVIGNASETGGESKPGSVAMPREAFEFTLKDTDIEVYSGFNITFYGYVENIGEKPLVVNSRISKECCAVSLDDEFVLPAGNAFDFPISVHVPLNESEGEYNIGILLVGGSQEKLKTIRLLVLTNQNVLALERLRNIVNDIKAEIEMYESDGFDVVQLKIKLREAERLISSGENAIENDDISGLNDVISPLQMNTESILSSLFYIKAEKFVVDNKWMILLFLAMLSFSVYLIFEIILPYFKLKDALIRLNRERRIIEETKKATEKQYFMRKISEEVFNRIMTSEQDKLMKTRSEIAEIEEYMAVLKKGSVSGFKRLKHERQERRKDVSKMQAMERALNKSTADFMREKLENSKLMLFVERLRRMMRKGQPQERADDSLNKMVRQNDGKPEVSFEKKEESNSGDGELREAIERLKKAVSEMDEDEKKD
ncbi:MAG: hypothetical protein ABIG84_03380 [archaeon]